MTIGLVYVCAFGCFFASVASVCTLSTQSLGNFNRCRFAVLFRHRHTFLPFFFLSFVRLDKKENKQGRNIARIHSGVHYLPLNLKNDRFRLGSTIENKKIDILWLACVALATKGKVMNSFFPFSVYFFCFRLEKWTMVGSGRTSNLFHSVQGSI